MFLEESLVVEDHFINLPALALGRKRSDCLTRVKMIEGTMLYCDCVEPAGACEMRHYVGFSTIYGA